MRDGICVVIYTCQVPDKGKQERTKFFCAGYFLFQISASFHQS